MEGSGSSRLRDVLIDDLIKLDRIHWLREISIHSHPQALLAHTFLRMGGESDDPDGATTFRFPPAAAGTLCAPQHARANLEVVIRTIGGAPGQIRTADLLVRSQTLYPTELWAQWSRHN